MGALFVIKEIYILHLNAYNQNYEEFSQPDDLSSSHSNNNTPPSSLLNEKNETNKNMDLIDFNDPNQVETNKKMDLINFNDPNQVETNVNNFSPVFNLLDSNDMQMETAQKVMTPKSSYPKAEIEMDKILIKKLSCFEEFDKMKTHDNKYKFLMDFDEKTPCPDWAKAKNLSESLKAQQKIDPEMIFGKPEGLNIEKIFNKNLIFNFENDYENWEPDVEDDFGDDALTEVAKISLPSGSGRNQYPWKSSPNYWVHASCDGY
ncbi:4828_t:CDS:2 [Diversispora eburnea]|uniref:4828_t:CDS:1 n=1 Tax=Diversispora eburnea TaxID=1213867 RepID=A0A9N9AJY4_9GLOM|nr:4828_t:CDS:2 [Diversispora eburnea]